MTEVNKHKRRTASGKTTTVRQHYRNTGDGDAARSAWGQRVASSSPAPHVSSLTPAEPAAAGETWWDGEAGAPAGDFWAEPDPVDAEFTRMQDEMRHWRALDIQAPRAEPDTSPLGRALGTDTQEGADRFARLKAYREAGYNGPLDSDGRIPDPDDPAEHESLHGLAALSLTH